jgi:hypothetical protein
MSRDHHLIRAALCSFQGTASVCHDKWIIDTVVCEIVIQLFPHAPVSKATLNKSTSISGFKMICHDSVVNEYNIYRRKYSKNGIINFLLQIVSPSCFQRMELFTVSCFSVDIIDTIS